MTDPMKELRGLLASYPTDFRIWDYLQAVPSAENRLQLAPWLIHEIRRPARGGGGRGLDSVASNTKGVLRFARDLGQTPFKGLRPRDANRIWAKIAATPDPMSEARRPKPPGDKRLYSFKTDLIRFLTFIFGDQAEAVRRATPPQNPLPAPTIPRMKTWKELFAVLSGIAVLSHRAAWVLCTATLLGISEICRLNVEDVCFDDNLCFVKAHPSPGFPEGRAVPLLFGDEILAAYVRQQQEARPNGGPLFPSIHGPDTSMAVATLALKIAKWTTSTLGEATSHSDLHRGLKAWFLSTKEVHEDLIAEWAGNMGDGELAAIRREVYTALERNHRFDPLPSPEERGIRGRRACSACGRPDNPLDASNCMFCGAHFSLPGESARERGIKAFGQLMNVIMDQTGLALEELADKALRYNATRGNSDG